MDDNVAAVIVAQLLFLEAENPEKPISLYINSPGGSVTAGMAIYDTVSVLLLLLLLLLWISIFNAKANSNLQMQV